MPTGPTAKAKLLILADLAADVGNQFAQLALLELLVFRGKSSLSNLLFLCLLDQGPAILLARFAGAGIGRIGGRAWLVLVNLCKLICVGFLAFLTSRMAIFPVYFCFSICSLFFNIGRLSMAPMLVPQKDLIRFNALNEQIALAGRIFGPCVISWAVLVNGQQVALGLAGIFFLGSAISAWFLRGTTKASISQKKLAPVAQTCAQAHASAANASPQEILPLSQNCNRIRKANFVAMGFLLVGGAILNFGTPILFRNNFEGNIGVWGLNLSGFQAGAWLASILLPRCSTTFRHSDILWVSFLILGGAMAALGQANTNLHLILLMSLFGFAFTLIHLLVQSLIQQTCSEQNSSQGRVAKTISSLMSYSGICYVVVILASSLVINVTGPKFLFWIGAIIMGGGAIVFGFRERAWSKNAGAL